MDNEKRKGRAAIPDHFKKLLNEEQKVSLRQLEKFGWEVRFVRMPLFQPLIIALYHSSNDKFGILDEKGNLDTEFDLKVRN